MRPPNNINTSRPIQISVDGRDSYIQVDTGGYNLTNDGIECNDPDTSIFIPWKYIQWIEQSTAVDTVFNRQTTHKNQGTNSAITNPASIVDSRDDEIRLLERNNPFARIDMKLFKQCVNNHIIEHDENGWRIRISNQRIGYNEDQAMSVIRSNPSLQVYLAQSLSTIPLSDTDENHASTNANMNTVNNASMNQVTSDNDNKKQSHYTNDPWITIDDDTANDNGMQALLKVDPQADNEYMLDDYDDNMSYTPEMLIESYNDDTHSNTTSTASNDSTTANSDSKTVNTMNSKTASNASTSSADADAGDSTTASMSNKQTTTRHREQSYAPTEPGFSFGFGFTTNNKNTTTNANSANNSSMGSHDSHEISNVNYKNNNLNTVNNDVHMTAAHMPNAITNASTVNTDTGTVSTNADTSKLVSSMNGESSSSNGMHVSDTASMQPSSSMMNNTASHVNNSSDYANNSYSIDNNATSPIHPSRKKKNPVKHHLTDYEVDDSSNTDNATTADENGCDWVVLMVALGYAGTIVSRWRSRAEAEADRDARIENNNVNSSMIPLNYMVFRANGNRLYDRKYIPRDKNGIPLKGYNEYGEYVAGLPGYEF